MTEIAQRRVAVLVDGDNIGADHATAIAANGAALGAVVARRVYGNVHLLPRWDAQPGFRIIHAGSGKNATDMLLVIEALDLAHRQAAEAFVIATSDRDFSHLAHHLRERGAHVLGLGEAKAPDGFRAACSEFEELCCMAKTARPCSHAMPEAVQPSGPLRLSAMDIKLRDLIAAHSPVGRGMRLNELGMKMQRQHGIKISHVSHATWRKYLESKPTLYDLDPRGPDALARFRKAGFAQV